MRNIFVIGGLFCGLSGCAYFDAPKGAVATPNGMAPAAAALSAPATTRAVAAVKLPGPFSPTVLPGRGLAEHDFLYTGEWDTRRKDQEMTVVRGGKIVWQYAIDLNDASGTLQELGDATFMPNGNIAFCRKVGFAVITPEKKIVWSLDAPKGTEMHSIQVLDNEHVLVVQQGNPAKAMSINIVNNTVEKEVILPTGKPASAHLQFRRVTLIAGSNGKPTLLAAHLDNNKVAEYDADTGKEVWSVAAPNPWSAVRLANGNTLIGCSTAGVREVNGKGEIVWQFTQKDMPPDMKMFIIQEVSRLANGDTVMCNWCPSMMKAQPEDWGKTVQVLEVTPEKKVVWALRSWSGTEDLGPASSIQILDEAGLQR